MNTPEALVMEYLNEPQGTVKKVELEARIAQNVQCVALLQEQQEIKTMLAGLAAPEVPADLFTTISSQIRTTTQLPAGHVTHPVVNGLITGAIVVGMMGVSLWLYGVLLDAVNTTQNQPSNLQSSPVVQQKLSLVNSQNYDTYWLEGYRGLVLNDVQNLIADDELIHMKQNAANAVALGYYGDVRLYYPMSNDAAARAGEDILAATEMQMHSGAADTEEISMMLERASIVTHRVKTRK